ncbi:hypothetical protein NIASO_09495 [Niabella soli DSM 19437]|uniref:Uncharacterized protein n=1 Tax=Niabella soli DSM 19437 TaxID=929713 RepID=W0F3D6_9BACT|nr:hypothetical protein NIASO_09495 [Niabella soli DSM 19437]
MPVHYKMKFPRMAQINGRKEKHCEEAPRISMFAFIELIPDYATASSSA